MSAPTFGNVGIEKDVLYFVFPRSKIAGLTPANAKQRIAEEGERLFNALLTPSGNP